MTTWPSTLKILKDNFSESPPDRVIRSSMEIGPAKIRRRSSSAIRPVQFKMMLNDTQLTAFETFYEANDALSFDFTHPRTSVVWKARFVEVPSVSVKETLYSVFVKLELLP